MKRTEIRSNYAKRRWLKQFLRQINCETFAGYIAFVDELIEPLMEIDERQAAGMTAEQSATRNRKARVETSSAAIEDLADAASNARIIVTRRAKREGFPGGLLDAFGFRNPRPKSNKSRDWILVGEDLIKGDAEAVSMGFEPMRFPSSEELAVLVKAAEDAVVAVDAADGELYKIQVELRDTSTELGELILDLLALMRYKLRRKPRSEQRRILRKLGFSFDGQIPEDELEDGEQPDQSEEQDAGETDASEDQEAAQS